jgi:SGNH domain (fused to AT3 domains)
MYLAALGVVVLGAGGVLVVLLGATGETSSRHAVHARPTTRATVPATSPGPPTTAPVPPTTATVPPPPTTAVPPKLKVVFVGDSVAGSLAPGMTQVLAGHGATFVNAGVTGCPVANGVTVNADTGVPFPHSERCAGLVPLYQATVIAKERPDLVLWLSTWETADRLVNGQHLRSGTPEHDADVLRAMEEARVRLTPHGARLVMLTSVPLADSEFGRAPLPYPDLHLTDLIRRFAAEHTDNVRVVDLAAIVCPTYPCPTVMDGVLIRPGGGHYTPESSVWVAQRLVPQVLAAFPHLRPGAG